MFDDRLKNLRENKGYSMRQMAEMLGMKYTTYVNYEKNNREPDSETLIILSKYFGVTVDYLLGLSEIKNAPKLEKEMSPELSEVVDAYSKHPEMHHAIRTLLGLDSADQAIPQPEVLTFKRIARKGGLPTEITLTQEELDELLNQPEPDF